MKTSLYTSSLLASLLLGACGAEDPSFVTQSLGRYMVEVEEGRAGSEVDTLENTYSVDESSLDAIEKDAEEAGLDLDSQLAIDEQVEDTGADEEDDMTRESPKGEMSQGKAKGQEGRAPKASGSPSKSDDSDTQKVVDQADKGSGDAVTQAPAGGSADDGGESSGGGNPVPPSDSDADRALAKACAPHFRGIGTKIRVLSVDRPGEAVTISPDTVIAFHLRGNGDRIELNLGASQGVAGLCLILSGNESQAQINSASSFQKLVYAGRGNQSLSRINMLDGASIGSMNIEMNGNQPQLHISGVSQEACSGAKVRGKAASLTCKP